MRHLIKTENVIIDYCLVSTNNYYLTIVTFLITFFYSCLNAAGIEIYFCERENEDFFGILLNNFLWKVLKPQFCFEN